MNGMDFDVLYPARFMKAGQFGGKDYTLTIKSVNVEELGEGQKAKQQVLVRFEEAKKEWVANKTNGICLREMFGRNAANWIGKRVTLFPMPMKDPFTGQNIVAIRVRGSPDLQHDLAFQARLGTGIISMVMRKTQAAAKATPAASAAPQPPAPPPDLEPPPMDEPPPDFGPMPGAAGYGGAP